ncbi:methylated-DNA--[protein]-cysteine S-methyltransferase [Corynebacterium uterequi]|uniref:methylated-DNA--[protein]-cysteine S-methyltransferase n=1 Tax=Corynebacterium uterequi TaxID=1072256 RepID=A0A0G3HFK4_9CORY|nr:methylated-DNA--[protein]-cysteine S-methyltransferase [Corynebacterium uterequi]AKK10708.1 O-6-methylguanine DNA methyltransferase [Corynebacterium uterequi]
MSARFVDEDSPIGVLRLIADGPGLAYVAFLAVERPPEAFATAVASPDDELLAEARRQLREYFAGVRRRFMVPLAGAGSSFRWRAQQTLGRIGFAETWNYGELAAAAGNPRAVRAAGSACATNPVPLFLPCHRVIRADGSAGGYRGGPAAKLWLLEHERAVLASTPEPRTKDGRRT